MTRAEALFVAEFNDKSIKRRLMSLCEHRSDLSVILAVDSEIPLTREEHLGILRVRGLGRYTYRHIVNVLFRRQVIRCSCGAKLSLKEVDFTAIF